MEHNDQIQLAGVELARVIRDTRALQAHLPRLDAAPRSAAQIAGTLGAYDPETRSVPILASTPKPISNESLVGWDLDRFAKNPVILWSHDADAIPIGLASNVAFDPDTGLNMTVTFASARANPLAEMIANAVAEGVVRAVSVGYEPGPIIGAKGDVIQRAANALVEVSFVPIGADENAGTPALTGDVSEAGRALALHGARKRSLKEEDGTVVDDEDRHDATEPVDIAAARAIRDEQMRTAWIPRASAGR